MSFDRAPGTRPQGRPLGLAAGSTLQRSENPRLPQTARPSTIRPVTNGATNGRGADLPIAIIGAGFAGIGTAIRLKQAGIESFTMFERAGEVGGTWRDNTYPGAACETCVPGTGCEEVPRNDCFLSTEPFRSKILIKDATPDAIDKVIWKWIRGEAVTNADFGDPTTTDDYAFCVYDANGLVMQAHIPAAGTCGTKPCWKALNGKGYKYVNSAATPEGIQKLLVKAGGAGLSKAILKGKGDNLLMPTTMPLILNVQAELRSSNGMCWSTIHTTTGTSRNDSGQFKSKDGN
jgi:hypothetical protein